MLNSISVMLYGLCAAIFCGFCSAIYLRILLRNTFAKFAALRRIRKDCLAMFTRRLFARHIYGCNLRHVSYLLSTRFNAFFLTRNAIYDVISESYNLIKRERARITLIHAINETLDYSRDVFTRDVFLIRIIFYTSFNIFSRFSTRNTRFVRDLKVL